MKHFNKNQYIGLLVYLAALSAFAPFSTDSYLPAMPLLQKLFNAPASSVQLTLSLFFIAFALMQLIWGPLSDRMGRKLIVLSGVSIYVIASLFCAWSNNIGMLIAARIFQAIGACSGIVMATSMVKDYFPEHKTMSKVFSVMLSVMVLAPMIAPIIGSYLLVYINWQANFYFLAVYGFLLIIATFFVNESYPKDIRKPLPINQLVKAYWQQITYRPFLLATIAGSTNFSILFAFISSSPFIYIKIYHLPTSLFGYFFAINAFAIILGTLFLNKVLKKRKISDRRIIIIALSFSLTAAIVMSVLLSIGFKSIFIVVVLAFIVTFTVGILYPELMAYALKNVVAYTGLASSLAGVSRFILAALTSMLMGIVINKTALPLAIAMILFNGCTMMTMFFYFRKEIPKS